MEYFLKIFFFIVSIRIIRCLKDKFELRWLQNSKLSNGAREIISDLLEVSIYVIKFLKVISEHVRNNKCFSTSKEFRHQSDEFFLKVLTDIADSLTSRINDNFQILNPAS